MKAVLWIAPIWLAAHMAWAQETKPVVITDPAAPPSVNEFGLPLGDQRTLTAPSSQPLKPRTVSPAEGAAPTVTRVPVTAASESNGWRYRQHNGQWWYWMPSNRWVIWTGNAWTPYDPATYVPYSTGYRGSAYDPYNRGAIIGNYGNRGLLPNRPAPATPRAANPTPPSQFPGFGDEAGRGSALQGGGGDGLGGEIGSREEAGNIHAGGSANSGQSSGTRARANIGMFGAPGGQIGGSGATAGQGVGGRTLGGSPGIPGATRSNFNQLRADSEARGNPATVVGGGEGSNTPPTGGGSP
ncbi:MAG TPA: hypothetical protein VGI40_20970 [Pirellulaceae bacterium]|jgi:hypothetical protein